MLTYFPPFRAAYTLRQCAFAKKVPSRLQLTAHVSSASLYFVHFLVSNEFWHLVTLHPEQSRDSMDKSIQSDSLETPRFKRLKYPNKMSVPRQPHEGGWDFAILRTPHLETVCYLPRLLFMNREYWTCKTVCPPGIWLWQIVSVWSTSNSETTLL